MQTKNKKAWRLIALCGTFITFLAFTLSLLQYFKYKQYLPLFICRYASVFINTELFACFIFMIFNPLEFRVYAVSFYIFALGNIIDNGNLLALFFLIGSFTFFYITDFFTEHKKVKSVCLILPLVAALVFQAYRNDFINFAISLMHIMAATFITAMILVLASPQIKKMRELKDTVYLDSASCTEQEVLWLNKVLQGEPYSTIAEEAEISESTVKIKMLRLYKMLDAKNKSEFCAMYRSSHIERR